MNNIKTQIDNGPTPTITARARCMADIEPQVVEWLWPDRIPTKAVLLAGNPGMGKSQLTIAIAAVVTNEGTWPDGTKSMQGGSVIFICAEDDAADTLRPRLDAAGANVRKVHVLDGIVDINGQPQGWNLKTGIPAVTKLCDDLGDVRLIIIDPISAYLGGVDGHSNSDVRGLLEPLMRVADKYRATVMMVSHLNKASGREAMTRVSGSGAFVAASRAAFIVADHPDVEDAYCVATLKQNLSPIKNAIGYRVVAHDQTSRVEFLEGVLDVDADTLLAPVDRLGDVDLDAESAKGDACRFLIDLLQSGPVPSATVYKEADAAGIAKATLKRAKKQLHIRSEKDAGRWYMRLPDRFDKYQGDHGTPHVDSDPLDTLDSLDGQEDQGN